MGVFEIAEDCGHFTDRRSVGKDERWDDATRVDPGVGTSENCSFAPRSTGTRVTLMPFSASKIRTRREFG
jgi:hypothetical protein